MDHLLFLIFACDFLVKFSSSTHVHFENFYVTKSLCINIKILNFIKQVNMLELII